MSYNGNQKKKVLIDLDVNMLNSILACLVFAEINPFEKRILCNDLISLDFDIISSFKEFRLKTLYSLIIFLSKTFIEHPEMSLDDIVAVITSNFANEDELEVVEDEFASAEDKAANDEIDYSLIVKYIKNRKNYIGLFKHKDELIDLVSRIENNDFGGDLEEFVQEFCETLDVTRKTLSPTLSDDEAEDFILGVDEESYRAEAVFEKSIKKLNDPTNVLKTGLQLLNRQLGEVGGLELGREYLFGGPAGSGKSLFLMRIMFWIWKYNPERLDQTTGKRNIAIYISGENSQVETAQRIYELFFPEEYVLSNPFKKQTPKQVMDLFHSEGFNNDNSFALAFLYRRNKSINTKDLENIIDYYNNLGYCVKAVVQDYTKRINPVDKRNDIRLDLGAVVDEFATIAKVKNVMLASAVQLNSEAIAALEEGIEKGNLNVLEKIGTKSVGESKLMVENTDFLFLIYIELSKVLHKSFQTIKLIKSRGKPNPTAPIYFAQPFANWKQTPHLIDDINEKAPIGVLNIGDLLDDLHMNEAAKPSSTEFNPKAEPSVKENVDRRSAIKKSLNTFRKHAKTNPITETSEEDEF
jgi:hypothetical protein